MTIFYNVLPVFEYILWIASQTFRLHEEKVFGYEASNV